MERIPCDDFWWNTIEEMRSPRTQQLGKEIAAVLAQLQDLKPPPHPEFVRSVKGGPVMDCCFGDALAGPFASVGALRSYVRRGSGLEAWKDWPDVLKVHGRSDEYETKFTHADLNPTNILVRGGHVVGVIDCECAGWYPEYWE